VCERVFFGKNGGKVSIYGKKGKNQLIGCGG